MSRVSIKCVWTRRVDESSCFSTVSLGAVWLDDELGDQRDDLGVPRRDHGRRQHGMIAFDLAVAVLTRLTMPAGDLPAAEILGPIDGDARSAAEPDERLTHRRFEEPLLDRLEAGRERGRVRPVERVPDIIVRRDFLDPEQGLAVRPAPAPLQRPLEGQGGRALHEDHSERRQPETRHRDIAAPPLARVRERSANSLQARQKRRQNLHLRRESCFR